MKNEKKKWKDKPKLATAYLVFVVCVKNFPFQLVYVCIV